MRNNEILVIRFGSLGDVILTSATVLNLKLNFSGCRLSFLTKARYEPVVRFFDGVDDVVTLSDTASALDLARLLSGLSDRNFDLVVDLHGNSRSWLTRKLTTTVNSLVYPKRRLERFLAVSRKQFPTAVFHTIDLYNDVLHQLYKPVFCHRPLMQPGVSEADVSGSPASDRPIVAVGPGAAHTNKQWPIDRFAEVARRLHDSFKARIVWVVTRQDAGRSGLESDLPAEDFLELVDYPIEQLASVFAGANLAITNDSGLSHTASAVGTPVIAVFGPTHPVLGFTPRGLFDRVVEIEENCRPCSRHGRKPCYREERFCFTRITPEVVVEAATEMLDSSLNRFPALFVDRDGTIIVDKEYLADENKVELIEGSAEALRQAGDAGYKIVVVSNQSGVARGYHGIQAVERVNRRLLELLGREHVTVDAIYYCPHHPTRGRVPKYSVKCDCRKPHAGMPEQAARELGIDLRRSVVIGDSTVDMHLGRVIGARSILVRTGFGREVEEKILAGGEASRPAVFNRLYKAVEHIIKNDASR